MDDLRQLTNKKLEPRVDLLKLVKNQQLRFQRADE